MTKRREGLEGFGTLPHSALEQHLCKLDQALADAWVGPARWLTRVGTESVYASLLAERLAVLDNAISYATHVNGVSESDDPLRLMNELFTLTEGARQFLHGPGKHTPGSGYQEVFLLCPPQEICQPNYFQVPKWMKGLGFAPANIFVTMKLITLRRVALDDLVAPIELVCLGSQWPAGNTTHYPSIYPGESRSARPTCGMCSMESSSDGRVRFVAVPA